jgi:uncharacterized membrane protein
MNLDKLFSCHAPRAPICYSFYLFPRWPLVDLVFIFVSSLVSSFFLGLVLFSDRMSIKMRDEHEISALVLIVLFNLPFE